MRDSGQDGKKEERRRERQEEEGSRKWQVRRRRESQSVDQSVRRQEREEESVMRLLPLSAVHVFVLPAITTTTHVSWSSVPSVAEPLPRLGSRCLEDRS